MAHDSHPFRLWLHEQGIAYSEAARRLEISPSFLSLIFNRSRAVTLELAVKIEDMTAGSVPMRQLARPPKKPPVRKKRRAA